jgi:hypothetical protein
VSIATSLNPTLVPDRDAPYRLGGVFELVVDGCRDELVLALDHATLKFRPDPDTDSLDVQFADADFQPLPNHRPLTGTALDRFAGSEFGWSWLAVNQQGFCDSAMLSFNGITPNVLIHVIGSSVMIFGIDRVVV